MKKLLLLLATMIIIIIALAASGYALFDCETETCTLNETDSKWSCEYIRCLEKPEFIENITVENITHYNVTDCNVEDLYPYWDSYIDRIDKRFNYSNKLKDKEISLDQCQNELSSCSEVQSECLSAAKNYGGFDSITGALSSANDDLREANEKLESEQQLSWGKMILAFGIGVGVIWFLNKKNKPEKTDIYPAEGEHSFNPKKIEEDAKIQQQQEEIKKLKDELEKAKRD